MNSHDWPVPSPSTAILSAVSNLRPRDNGRVISFDCPSCCKKRKAFAYHNLPDGTPNRFGAWRCSRTGCGAGGRLLERNSLAPFPPPRRRTTKSNNPRDRTLALRPCLGKLSESAARYLEERIPGADLSRLRPFLGNPALAARKSGGARRIARSGWELLSPLFSVDNPHVISSAACRWVRGVAELGDRPKVLNLSGSFGGDYGVTFGRIDKVLEQAEEDGFLVLVEGLIDFLTARACGFKNVIGVPGVAFARKVAKFLKKEGWEGRLILSLDGDDAGAKSVDEVLEELEGHEAISVLNGRPHGDRDLNDLYRESGPDAVLDLIKGARPIPRPLLIPTVKRSKEGKARARELYKRHRNDRYSALRALGWTGSCGVLREDKTRFKGDAVTGRLLRRTPRLCEEKGCLYCRAKTWPILVDHCREHWPKTLHLAVFPLEENTPEAVKKLRARLSRKTSKIRSKGGSYLTAPDPLGATLAVVVEGSNPELIEAIEHEAGRLEMATIDEALEQMKRAYFGPAQRAAEMLEQGANVESDPWCMKRTCSFSVVGDGLMLKKEKEAREEVRKEAKAQAQEKKKQEGQPASEEFDLFLYFKGQRLIAVMLEALERKNLMNIIESEPLEKVRPGSAGNLLDDPDFAGPVVRSWLEDLHQHHNGCAISEPRGRPPDAVKVTSYQEAAYYDRLGAIEDMRRIIEAARQLE